MPVLSPPGRFAAKPSRLRGLLLLLLGLFALVSPLFAGEWAIAIFGLVIVAGGGVMVIQAFYNDEAGRRRAQFAVGATAIVVGILIFAGPRLVFTGVVAVVAAMLLFNGTASLWAGLRPQAPHRGRLWAILNGVVTVGAAFLVWRLGSSAGLLAASLAVGVWCASLGWSILFSPDEGAESSESALARNEHPDQELGLDPHPVFGELRAAAVDVEESRRAYDLHWMVLLILIFLAIHIGRTGVNLTWLGLITPVLATLGDVAAAVLLGAALVLPWRTMWRKLTRPVERRAWNSLLPHWDDSNLKHGERLAKRWLEGRLGFAVRMRLYRSSLSNALWGVLQSGLPAIAVIVAVNPIWGFSWYFNTENWASGFWQKVTETRTDPWRTVMIEAVQKAYAADGLAASELFEVKPPGVAAAEDFSFIVLGDTGEGDPSQHILRDQLLYVGAKPQTKFVVVSSDVIYPDGLMKDYEANFYLPFKGIRKPICAIPGNHDWFAALDGFLPNFLEPKAAKASMRARIEADLRLTSTTDSDIEESVRKAGELRQQYRIEGANQRAPFFEIHSPKFTLIAADTGILRRLDEHQMAWFKAALERGKGRFTMVILGHPIYAGGANTAVGDEEFSAIGNLLRQYKVPVVMGGDTHDFEYYQEQNGGTATHHFVNGGGGAYLSIGTALNWPSTPPVSNYAFYPSTESVRTKLNAQTPNWKWPIWWWVRRFKGWPTSVETLSAVFDFNRAPFFQSFMEVNVEPSQQRVRLVLYGSNGPLHRRDLSIGGTMPAMGASPDDVAEWVVPFAAGD